MSIKMGYFTACIIPDVPPTDQFVALENTVYKLTSSLGGDYPNVGESLVY
jgi:hypothetical protein